MGSLPAERSSSFAKMQSFRSLEPLDVSLNQEIDQRPFGVDYGRLDNGLSYYVRCNPKPKMRAALALAVKVGSVVEEEDERGVAHIVEHLAFSATKKYTNHDIIKFLESIGAEFGPCHNASTSFDETIYELFVPIDKPELLSEAIFVLAEFSSEIRLSKDDLLKERGAVMEEYRGGRNANGRIEDAHWALMMQGSKYAERLPIGLEKVIQTVSSESLKQFYQKWYHLQNMAVIAVGDFSDKKSVIELIRTHFRHKHSELNPPPIPHFPVPSHKDPRFSYFVEPEASGSSVIISYKMQAGQLKTIKDFRDMLVESMFGNALNQRFFKISKGKDPPYFSCWAGTDDLVRQSKAYMMTSYCKEKGTLEALESILTEVARVRLYGFLEREISTVRASLLSSVESAYLERDQMESTSLRNEYVEHFIHDKPVIGIEYEAQLVKTILPHILPSEVSKYAEKLWTSSSCVIKIVEPRASAKINDLKNVAMKINKLEKEKSITPWDYDDVPEEIITSKPNAGNIMEQLEHSNIEATELILSNGMQVCYKCTDFSDDEVLFSGFSYGGLSELPENEYFSSLMGSELAGEVGVFGHRPSVLMDMLAGKRVNVGVEVGKYMRNFRGDCSPLYLETALQLVYQLFTTDVKPIEEEVKRVMQVEEEMILAQERDPFTAFANRVTEINYGKSYFFRPMRISNLKKVDPLKACEYFNSCFKDPSTFTVVIVGNIDPAVALPLIQEYLGGIPKPSEPIFHFNSGCIKELPFTYPTTIIREVVRSPMVEAQCRVHICIPIQLRRETMLQVEELQYIGFLSKLLENKILQLLRFKHGQIYAASVYDFLYGYLPCITTNVRGEISIDFSCDPKISSKLVDFALDEILRLQEEGPSDQDVSTILEIEQRAHENGLQENDYWLDMILGSYQSRIYSGDVGTSYKIRDEGRSKVRESLTPLTMQLALQRIVPFKNQHTVVILKPQLSLFKRLISFSQWNLHGRDAKILAGIAGLTVLAFSLRKYSQKS